MNSEETPDDQVVDDENVEQTTSDGAEDVGAENEDVGADENESVGADENESADAGPAPDSDARHALASFALSISVGALVAAVVCLGYFGYTGIRAYFVDAGRDQARVEAVDAAEQAVLNTFSIDDKSVQVWQDRMRSSLTGDALKQAIDETSSGTLQQIEAAKAKGLTVSTKIVRSAATEVNAGDDNATVLVLSQATSSAAPDQPQPQSNLLSMVKVDGTWKASKIVPLTGVTYDANTAEPAGTAPGADDQEQEGGN